MLEHANPGQLAGNVEEKFTTFPVGGRLLPMSINDGDSHRCYLTSVTARYFQVGGEALSRGSETPLLGKTLGNAVQSLGALGRALRLDRAVIVNNFLMSTPPEVSLSPLDCVNLRQRISAEYPGHAILIRGWHKLEKDPARQILECTGFTLLNRRVFVANLADQRRKIKRDVRKDIQHAHRHFVITDQPSMEPAIFFDMVRESYFDLYVRKYSCLHAHYTTYWFEQTFQQQFLKYLFLLNRTTGEYEGFISYFRAGDTLYIGPGGYLVSAARRRPLRALFGAIFERAFNSSALSINMGAGNTMFKINRGGTAVEEYDGVFFEHLTPAKRLIWGLAARAFDFGVQQYFKPLTTAR